MAFDLTGANWHLIFQQRCRVWLVQQCGTEDSQGLFMNGLCNRPEPQRLNWLSPVFPYKNDFVDTTTQHSKAASLSIFSHPLNTNAHTLQ